MPTTAELRAAVNRYAETVAMRDADAYAALFTPDAVQIDPYPTGFRNGREAIREFMQQTIESYESISFEVEECHLAADKAAIRFHMKIGKDGSAMHIRGLEIYTVADDGLINAVEAYWGDDDVTPE